MNDAVVFGLMEVQDPSVLLAEEPARLLERPIEAYAAFLEPSVELSEEHLEAIDYALRHNIVRLLTRAAGADELREAYAALRGLVPIEREEELGEWVPRWRGYADVLEARIAALAARVGAPDVFNLLHAKEIVALVGKHEGLKQTQIGESFKPPLKAANLSRILGVLEAAEQIERRSVGQAKRVYLGRLADRERWVSADETIEVVAADNARFVHNLLPMKKRVSAA